MNLDHKIHIINQHLMKEIQNLMIKMHFDKSLIIPIYHYLLVLLII